jgi:SAM-dependent methyltransferase
MKADKPGYYKKVSDYYDKDASLDFESRAEENPLLFKIRNDFRQITIKYPFENALEIGCGPGFDVAWFASEYPERNIVGVDISANMVSLAKDRIASNQLGNAKALVSDERELATNFETNEFDLIYVYFGALNTVADLDFAAEQIEKLLKPGGHAVLTFVNKWYLREMIVQGLKLKIRGALARIRKEWGGYSVDRHLPSRCYSPARIKKAFRKFKLLERKGYSIFFPAWYNFRKFINQKEKTDKLWEKDQRLQNSMLWSKGEYTLFVFKRD